jgi:hypothetical protein
MCAGSPKTKRDAAPGKGGVPLAANPAQINDMLDAAAYSDLIGA